MPELSEQSAFSITIAGFVVYVLGWVWMAVRGYRDRWWWGPVVLLVPFCVGAVAYAATHLRRAVGPLAVMAVGLAVAVAPPLYQRLVPPPQTAVVQQVNGERVGTLTGAADTDLVANLKQDRGRAVLQLANRADVTDDALRLLADFPALRELDLNDTPVTDAGLAVLATLPRLESLRIARTRATPEGVAQHVLGNPRLREVDVTGLGVPVKALREWKNADPTARKYVN